MHPRLATSVQKDPVFGDVACASTALLVSLVAVHVLLKAVFFSGWFLLEVANPAEQLTHGIMRPATTAGAIQFVVLLLGGVFLVGGLTPHQLGLRLGGLRRVLPVIVFVWVAAYIVCLGLGAQFARTGVGAPVFLGGILEAVLGSALPEELFYRGFLLVQLFLLFRLRRPSWTTDRCLVLAVVVVQLYFALHHAPAAVRAGLPVETTLLWLTQTALVGGMMAALFIQTRNLLMPVAAHALVNLAIPVLVSPVPPQLVLLVLFCATMVAGQWVFGRDLRGRKVTPAT